MAGASLSKGRQEGCLLSVGKVDYETLATSFFVWWCLIRPASYDCRVYL